MRITSYSTNAAFESSFGGISRKHTRQNAVRDADVTEIGGDGKVPERHGASTRSHPPLRSDSERPGRRRFQIRAADWRSRELMVSREYLRFVVGVVVNEKFEANRKRTGWWKLRECPVRAKAKLVNACEWNPHGVEALRRNVQANSMSDR